MRHVSWTEVPQTGKRKIIFKMVHRFLSETCFLTKFIVFILTIYGSKLRQGSARHVSFLCGMDEEREVSLHGGWAGLEGPGWPRTHSMGSWHFGRRARKPGLSWTTLLFPMVSKPLSRVSPEVLGLLIGQLGAVRRSGSARPRRSGPENWYSVTSTMLYSSISLQSLPRFTGRRPRRHLSLEMSRNVRPSLTCSKGLKGKHP